MMPKGKDDIAENAEAERAANATALRSFSSFIARVSDGHTDHRLSEALREIAEACNQYVIDNGGVPKAELMLKLAFKLDDGVFEIVPTIKTTLPKEPVHRAIFWCTPDNHFTPQNPRQLGFAFRDVSQGTKQ